MEIVNYSEMILEGDHILTDDLGQIIIFDCKKGSKEFKGIIKYWSSREENEYLEFELKSKEEDDEGDENVNVKINGIYYFISSKPSSKPIISIYFKKGRFYAKKYCDDNEVGGNHDLKVGGNGNISKVGGNEDAFNDTFKVNTPYFFTTPPSSYHSTPSPSFHHSPLEVILPCPSPLLDIIILNLPSSCSLHSSFSYFCFSNFKTYFGFIFSYFLEGYHYYSILLLSEFYNPLINNLIINNDNIPLFPNICFMITNNNNKELYLSNFINLNFNFPLDFLDKVIGSILNEERICFISKKDLLLKIMYFLKYIEPFKWSHSLIVSRSKDLKIIESPIPYIYGIIKGDNGEGYVGGKDRSKVDKGKGKDKGDYKAISNPPLNTPLSPNPSILNTPNNYILIDLDTFTITYPINHPNPPGPSITHPYFSEDFTLRLSHFLDLKKKLILNLNPDLVHDFLLYSHKYFLDDQFLIYPEDDHFSFFLKRFTSTRMFIRYLVEERFTPINYIYDIQFKKIEIIPFKNILDYKIEEVIKGYLMIYDIKNEKVYQKIYEKGGYRNRGKDKVGEGDHNLYDNITYRAPLLRILSIQKKFKSISDLIKRKPLSLKESQMINIYEEQRDFKIKEEDYEGMYFVNICDFRRDEDNGKGKGDIKVLDWIKDIKKKDINMIKNIHSPLNHNKDNCKFKTLILKNEMVFNLYPLSSLITVFLNLPKNVDLKEYPEIFYNLVGYFYYFDLPFNTEEVDYVI